MVGYASTTMRMWAGEALFLLNFFIVAPSIAVAIGYAAWRGKPESFDRWMFWAAFFGADVVVGFLMVFAQRMQADVRTWQYPVQVACFSIGALFFGIAGGCMIGIFTYRRGVRYENPPQ